MKVDVIRLEVPALPEYLALVRMVVAGTARIDPLLDDERIDDLRVIVSEACTNAIEASGLADGRTGGPPPTIVVECRLSVARVEVVVLDRGHGFDPAGLDTLPAATDPSRLQFERGLGIPLIRALADDVEISSGADGTRVRVALTVAGPDPAP